MVCRACEFSTEEGDEGQLGIEGLLQQHREFRDRLDYMLVLKPIAKKIHKQIFWDIRT